MLGIEADGATYHSSASARDRDRLRQELLESLGWRITRIWSTDWIRNPQRQIERVLNAYQAALSAASVADGPTSLAEAKPVDTVMPTVLTKASRDVFGGRSPMRYNSIEDVPFPVIEQLLHECLRDFGSTSVEDLLQHVSRSVGFARTGARIRERLHSSLIEMQRLGSIRVAGDRVTLSESGPTG